MTILAMLSPAEAEAARLSLLVATAAVAGSLPFGIACGWLLARYDFRGKALLETGLNLPLVLPPVVTGYFLLVLFGRQGWLGRVLDEWLGISLVFDWKGAALAAAVVSFPLMVRAIRLAFTSVDRRLEQAARTLGAGRFDAFLTISLPLALHGIIAGCVLAFARSIGEFGATIMIAGNIPGQTQTIPLFIYGQLETPGGVDRSRTAVVVAVVIAAAALIAGEWLERRGRARLRAQ
ncbi:MAG TPA: molybdate ABC transporter permease subunit [Planctomycetaceae bacterium]|nr:molybdate ABC transporter permease subunit [Planctomycetaceae bacterium]